MKLNELYTNTNHPSLPCSIIIRDNVNLFARSQMIDRHDKLIELMHTLKYHNDKSGICAGISEMGVQAFLCDDFKTYLNRINYLCGLEPAKFAEKIKTFSDAKTRATLS